MGKKMDPRVRRIRMGGGAKQWEGVDLDNDANRAKFVRFLKGWHGEMTTGYWESGFTRWLVYDCTVRPCGLRVEKISEDFVTLCAHCAGVQTEGICLDATFMVPTAKFKPAELYNMIGPYRWHIHGPACMFTWAPRRSDGRVDPMYITELSWWYDEVYDKSETSGEDEDDDEE